MTETVLVTGAGGFIGGHFYDEIWDDKHYRVLAFEGDITKREDCIRNLRGVDIVVNFAALTYLPPSWDNAEAYTNVNYQGVVNLLTSHSMFHKFIQMSTSHVYGNQTKIPITLENIPAPQDPYSIAKYAAEFAVKAYSKKFGFEYLIVRPFNNFGPEQSKHFVIPSFIEQGLKTGKIVVRGNTRREFVYVKDTVKILKIFLDAKSIGYRQICPNKPQLVKDVAQLIAQNIGNCEVEVGPSDRPGDIETLYGEKSPKLFAFTPIEKAIKETVQWYRRH